MTSRKGNSIHGLQGNAGPDEATGAARTTPPQPPAVIIMMAVCPYGTPRALSWVHPDSRRLAAGARGGQLPACLRGRAAMPIEKDMAIPCLLHP